MIIKSTTGYESYTLSVIIISSYGTTRMQVSGVLQKGTNLMKVAAEIPKKQASYVQALLKWSQFKIVQVTKCMKGPCWMLEQYTGFQWPSLFSLY